MPEIPPIRIVATGSVGWPPEDEMRKFILEQIAKMSAEEVLEFYKLICSKGTDA